MINQLKIACAQILVEDAKYLENLGRAYHAIKEAKKMNADIVVLPECFDFGWAYCKAGVITKDKYEYVYNTLAKYALDFGVYIVAGVSEVDGDTLYNSALTFDGIGNLVNKHRKINLLTGIEDHYEVGDSVSVFNSKWGKIGVNICADNIENSLCIAHTQARMKARLILSPSAWAVNKNDMNRAYGEEWIKPYQLLSRLYHINIIGVSNVGKISTGAWKDYNAIGNSIFVDEKMNVRMLPYSEEALAVFNINLVTQDYSGTDLSCHVGAILQEK